MTVTLWAHHCHHKLGRKSGVSWWVKPTLSPQKKLRPHPKQQLAAPYLHSTRSRRQSAGPWQSPQQSRPASRTPRPPTGCRAHRWQGKHATISPTSCRGCWSSCRGCWSSSASARRQRTWSRTSRARPAWLSGTISLWAARTPCSTWSTGEGACMSPTCGTSYRRCSWRYRRARGATPSSWVRIRPLPHTISGWTVRTTCWRRTQRRTRWRQSGLGCPRAGAVCTCRPRDIPVAQSAPQQSCPPRRAAAARAPCGPWQRRHGTLPGRRRRRADEEAWVGARGGPRRQTVTNGKALSGRAGSDRRAESAGRVGCALPVHWRWMERRAAVGAATHRGAA